MHSPPRTPTAAESGGVLQPDPKPEPAPPVEGVDYTVEGGLWVFTAAFHLKRGRCCENGCRHCPYGFTKPAAPPRPAGG